ncbi:probable beta-hexosaminidase fdl isoform X2 [Agrilus planipennis]|uniref:beta-N-acetylhexosaminidase n=1 Tax=Agrilus planipennis TaxID=224129 RepID=A0A1W4WM34_AGRPL|nr:probable beta-hexosaminidase fdl isoform X2 [Agrilus planipennis]
MFSIVKCFKIIVQGMYLRCRDRYIKRTMKQMGKKKLLLALLLFSGGFILYFVWIQNTFEFPTIVHSLRTAYQTNMKSDPRWTWRCHNERCERHIKKENEKSASLITCNMLCGQPKLWPFPTGSLYVSEDSVTFFYHQISVLYFAKNPVRSLLEQSFAVFNQNVINMVPTTYKTSYKSDIKRFLVVVSVTHPNQNKLTLSTDESYTLAMNMNGDDLVATIKAGTYFGARHGLETLSQLIWWDDHPPEGILRTVKAANIQDAPVFAYRGLMIDTARNFMPVDSLKRTLIGMSMNKLNIFHWHMTDSQSFPFSTPSVPKMAQYGAYGPDMVYTPQDIQELVEFAYHLGIRVVIEIDTPAHAGNGWNWGPEEGLGDLAVCVNEQPWNLYCGEPPCGQLNPLNPNTYEVLEKLYKDIIRLTGETELFHMGGDEVNLDCWGQFLKGINYTDFHDLWGLFTMKALEKLASANGGNLPSNMIFWSSNLSRRPYITRYMDKSKTIIQIWSPSLWSDTYDILADGYRVIMSHVDAWYLDCGFGRWRETGEAACDPYRSWQTMYLHRPWQESMDKNLVVGAEACLWSEQLDAASLDARLWPRTSAFAERVWSDPEKDVKMYTIKESVYTRLTIQRDRLISRGLGAEALWPLWCSQNPGLCL